MLIGRHRRLYYYHLKKCGGSTLNNWLDTLTSAERLDDPAWTGTWMFGDPAYEVTADAASRERRKATALFYWSDVIHSHAPIRTYAPEGTFCFTVLRDPVARLASQVRDWRRLRPQDVEQEPEHIRSCVADAQRLHLRDMLLRHGFGSGRLVLNNYLTRALAAGRIGRLALDVTDAARLLDIALQSLESDYDFVGLTERLQPSRNALCALLGLPAARPIPVMNATDASDRDAEELDEAQAVLQSLTTVDAVVYDRARRLFETRWSALAEAYTDAYFEQHNAASTVGALRPRWTQGAARLSVRDPLVGAGLHGRDGVGTPGCAVWTGPDTAATLYMPVPPNTALDVLVWIRGYAGPELRQALQVRIDGRAVPHELVPEPQYADLLVVRAGSERGFIRLDLEVPETLADPPEDLRLRGVSFDAYGWRVV